MGKWIQNKEKRTFTNVLMNLNFAGVAGIEPALTVLETGVLPLYDTPMPY